MKAFGIIMLIALIAVGTWNALQIHEADIVMKQNDSLTVANDKLNYQVEQLQMEIYKMHHPNRLEE